jgi:hypothetical protein
MIRLMLRFASLVAAFVAMIAPAPEAVAQSPGLRFQNLSAETVAGRRLTLSNGNAIEYFNDGRANFIRPDGRVQQGRWALNGAVSGHPRSLTIHWNNGRSAVFHYESRGEAFFHVVTYGRRGRGPAFPIRAITPAGSGIGS